MRRTSIALAAAVVSFSGLISPARAAGGTVEATAAWVRQSLGDGIVVVAVCTARSASAAGEIAVVTSVWCTANGFQSPTVSTPGPVSVTAVGNATTLPLEICVYGLTTFSPTIGAPYTVTDSECRTVV